MAFAVVAQPQSRSFQFNAGRTDGRIKYSRSSFTCSRVNCEYILHETTYNAHIHSARAVVKKKIK